jgi:hypothetical protein
MQKYKYLVALGGVIFLAVVIITNVHFILKFHNDWDVGQLSPDVKLKYSDVLLRNLIYQILPLNLVFMSFYAIALWIYRK